jgi:hypothetical protein
MVIKTLLIFILVAILMEDGSSIRKTAEEVKEEEEVAKAVNRTLAEEKRKEDEEKKKQQNQEKKQEDGDEKAFVEKQEGQDEACPPVNFTCPVVKPCSPCPKVKECPTPVGCQPCVECGSCIKCEEQEECPPLECPPVLPCPVDNSTRRGQELPSPPSCPDLPSMTVPTALAVGAVTGIMVTGIAAAMGLILRYVSPIVSGFLFLATIIIVWYLCSQYPETARELGGRVMDILREASVALSHRVMDALQRHRDQVSVPIKSNLFLLE